MKLKLYTSRVECIDEFDDISFVVSTFDECTAEVNIKHPVHTLASWKEMAKAVEKAIKRLELKE